MARRDPAKLKKVSLRLPFGIGEAEWEADPTQRKAAWSLYVELVTRVAVEPLGEEQGLLREALASLHSLFGTTRLVLREAGPDVGISAASLGAIAIAVLNRGIRPFLAKWHPALQAWEAQRSSSVAPNDHERQWPQHAELRAELEELRRELSKYADALAEISGVG